MRILVIAPRLPYPPTWGSSMRSYQLTRLLARNHEVTLLCYADAYAGERESAFAPELKALRTVLLPDDGGVRGRRAAQLRSLVSGRPYLVTAETTTEMQSALDELVGTEAFDTIQVEALSMSAFRFPTGVPVVLNEHNLEYEILQRMSTTERSVLRRTYNRAELLGVRRYERRRWREVAGCAITSEREARIVRAAAPQTPTVAVPNGVDVEFFTPWPDPPVPDSLVFTGLLSYRPNIDAVHYLVEEIMPIIRRSRPEVTLTVVGGGEADVAHLAGSGVTFTGYVLDLRPFIGRASVALAPIRMGSGTRLKVVEALAMAKAVVSTSIGSEGLDLRDGEHLLIADTATDFANRVVGLLEQPEQARGLGERGAALTRAEYSWAGSAESLEALHLSLAKNEALG
jgi:glycosyltransferase involved in cell wall biosynthesis